MIKVKKSDADLIIPPPVRKKLQKSSQQISSLKVLFEGIQKDAARSGDKGFAKDVEKLVLTAEKLIKLIKKL